MRLLTTFSRAADAELAKAVLVAAGIQARVADNSAMQEMLDYRLVVEEGRVEEAADLLGVDVPELPPEAPRWTSLALAVIVLIIGLSVVVVLFRG